MTDLKIAWKELVRGFAKFCAVEWFSFQCSCGEGGVVHRIPKHVGSVVWFGCGCGTNWTLTWNGDSFDARMSHGLQGQYGNQANQAANQAHISELADWPKGSKFWTKGRAISYHLQLPDEPGYIPHLLEARLRSDGYLFVVNTRADRSLHVMNAEVYWDQLLSGDPGEHFFAVEEFDREFEEQLKSVEKSYPGAVETESIFTKERKSLEEIKNYGDEGTIYGVTRVSYTGGFSANGEGDPTQRG